MRAGVRRVVRTAAALIIPGAIVGVVLSFALMAANLHVNPVYLSLECVLVLALFRLGRFILSDLEPPTRLRHGPIPVDSRRLEVLLPLERRLAAATRQQRLFLGGLQPMLWDLARERVRLHRGVDLDALRERDPAGAREVLGDSVWQWLTITDEEVEPPDPETVQRLVLAVGRL